MSRMMGDSRAVQAGKVGVSLPTREAYEKSKPFDVGVVQIKIN